MSAFTVPNPLLKHMLEQGEVLDRNDQSRPLAEGVMPEHAQALYQTVLTERPRSVVEIGLAYGVASLAILTALAEIGEGGHLTSIDPFQSTGWDGIGVMNIQRANMADAHTLVEDFDYLALPRMLGEGAAFDFAYVDGWHNFEYVLLDIFYIVKLLRTGSVVGFNDCDWLPVRAALHFLERHRDFGSIDVGLPARYGDRVKWTRKIRSLDRRFTGSRVTESRPVGMMLGRRREDQYFRKRSDDERAHGFWARV